jgi:signal transduction histidine kinase
VYPAGLTADLARPPAQPPAARDAERRRLRRDLHDGLGPALAGMAFRIDATARLLPIEPGRAADQLATMRADLRGAIGDVRRLVDGLRPAALDELGLVNALRAQASRTGDVIVEVDAPPSLPALPAAVEVAAYRIITEAMTNVARHAAARTCTVRLSADTALRIEIADDGRGLPEHPRPGVGLTSMRERAAELGGACSTESRPGAGTLISIRLPLTAEQR